VEKSRTVNVEGVTIELRVDESLIPSALRAFAGTTSTDAEVDALALPQKPWLLHICVQLLRWYRANISPRIGQRCVFEPSCSRYAELALRRHGLFKGLWLILGRVHRCRPGVGGMDLP
jgi:putative membrane protein insertion efficiency factor